MFGSGSTVKMCIINSSASYTMYNNIHSVTNISHMFFSCISIKKKASTIILTTFYITKACSVLLITQFVIVHNVFPQFSMLQKNLMYRTMRTLWQHIKYALK